MSRRHAKKSLGFGSDSFLDVLANIVGILIILIVIAGARIRSSNLPSKEELARLQAEKAAADAAAAVPAMTTADEPAVSTEKKTEPEPLPARFTVPEEWLAEQESLASGEQLTAAELDELSKHLDEMMRRQSAAVTEAALLEKLEQTAETDLEKSRIGFFKSTEELSQRQQKLNGLLADFEEISNASPPSIEVRHRVTPVSQTVIGKELHFRVIGGKVSVVPYDDLVERVKDSIARKKDLIARVRRIAGSAGPIDGYTMEYIVERKAASVLDELQLGGNGTMYRLEVAEIEIVPQATLEAESVTRALHPGSAFASALRRAGPRTALTFWVYPDSFGVFRELQNACHAEGFLVTGRPLPMGKNITGSPSGSRSAAQ